MDYENDVMYYPDQYMFNREVYLFKYYFEIHLIY